MMNKCVPLKKLEISNEGCRVFASPALSDTGGEEVPVHFLD